MILTTGTFSVSASGTTKGWQKDNYGWWYKTGKNTYAKNEFLNINGNFYLFDSNGYMCTGWNYINNGWCFANTDGVIVRDGWVYSNNKWYYIDLGKMCTGWLIVKNDKYYLDNSGAMRTGWAYINNNWYYFNSNGTMATNITIDGWKIDSSGIAKEIKADDKIITPNIKDEKFTNNEIYNKNLYCMSNTKGNFQP